MLFVTNSENLIGFCLHCLEAKSKSSLNHQPKPFVNWSFRSGFPPPGPSVGTKNVCACTWPAGAHSCLCMPLYWLLCVGEGGLLPDPSTQSTVEMQPAACALRLQPVSPTLPGLSGRPLRPLLALCRAGGALQLAPLAFVTGMEVTFCCAAQKTKSGGNQGWQRLAERAQ